MKYATYLRKLYCRSKFPLGRKWPPGPSPCKKIIRLAIIDRKQQTQETVPLTFESVDEYMHENSLCLVSLENLLEPRDGSSPKIVAVQGVPGIGKSTFAWKLCRKWAKGKIYQEYSLVLLLRMRDTRIRSATKLWELFFYEDEELSRKVAKEIVDIQGAGVLFLIEGLDELPLSCLAEGEVLSNLLQGLSLPEVTFIVTTRPWAEQILAEKCGEQITRRVEILGFTTEDIWRYVSHAFGDKEERVEFSKYLRSHPQLESIMHMHSTKCYFCSSDF